VIIEGITDLRLTRCYGAASAKERLDVAIRDAIYAGDIPGPRSLANGQEMAKRDGDLEAAITAFADTPEEMREVIRHNVSLGVDNIKLVMSGEEVGSQGPDRFKLAVADLEHRSAKYGQPRTAISQTKRRPPAWTKHTKQPEVTRMSKWSNSCEDTTPVFESWLLQQLLGKMWKRCKK